jgi:6-phosphofructokinase
LKKIAILTRDCAGVNAAIRAIVRTALHFEIEVIGVKNKKTL